MCHFTENTCFFQRHRRLIHCKFRGNLTTKLDLSAINCECPLWANSGHTMPASAARRRPVGWRQLLGINLIRDSISNRIDVGVGIVLLTLLKRQNRGILNHATINIHSPSNSLIFLPTITARQYSR